MAARLVDVAGPTRSGVGADPSGSETIGPQSTETRLRTLTEAFESGRLTARVGSVLALDEARAAHEMLAGAPHKKGKIVLRVG